MHHHVHHHVHCHVHCRYSVGPWVAWRKTTGTIEPGGPTQWSSTWVRTKISPPPPSLSTSSLSSLSLFVCVFVCVCVCARARARMCPTRSLLLSPSPSLPLSLPLTFLSLSPSVSLCPHPSLPRAFSPPSPCVCAHARVCAAYRNPFRVLPWFDLPPFHGAGQGPTTTTVSLPTRRITPSSPTSLTRTTHWWTASPRRPCM